MALSQQERIGLEDALKLEHLCIQKYATYAQQASDQQLKQMFSQHGQQEQQHAQTIEQLLQGQQPQSSGGQQGQAQNQAQYGQQHSQTQAGYDNDMQLCADLLMTEDHVSSEYDKLVFSTANPAIRQAVQHIQQEEQQHGVDIIDYMAQHSHYPM